MVLHQEAIGEALEEQPVSSCRHHWIIEPANGPTSRGICRNCRQSKWFNNSIVDHDPESHDLQSAGRVDSSANDSATEK